MNKFAVSAVIALSLAVISTVNAGAKNCAPDGTVCETMPTGKGPIKRLVKVAHVISVFGSQDTQDVIITVETTIDTPAQDTPVVSENGKHCNKGDGNGGEGCDPGNHPEKGNNDEN